MTTRRSELVESARQSIRQGSKSFAAASRLFDKRTRERVWLLYAWCRRCDDLADEQDHGGRLGEQAFAQDRLATIKDLTDQALRGEPTGDPAFDAFALVAAECGLTRKMADDVIAGFALDADGWRPRTEGDMMRYCYHVAGAVGVMMAVVMGVSPDDDETLDRACDLGLAFQLGNIARDISEDDAGGRCYLPMEWLAEMDIPPGQHMKPPYRAKLAQLARRLAKLSDIHERSARFGARKLAFRQRWAVLSAARIYGAIAREVAQLGEHAWDYRVHTGALAKIAYVAQGFADAFKEPTAPTSQPEWRRRHLAMQS